MDELLLEELDVSQEQAEWAQVTDDLAVLDSYYTEIATVGGVSREHARALVAQCGVQLGERYPPQSFTEIPSKTNLTVTMEGILDRTGSLIADLLKRAAALLLKIVRWILALLKDARSRAKRVIVKAANVTALKKANEQLDKVVPTESSSLTPAQQAEVSKAEKTVTSAAEIYERNFNDLVADLMVGGAFTKTVRQLDFVFAEYAPIVRNKLALFDKVLHQRPQAGAPQNDVVALSELKTIATPIPAQHAAQTLKAINVQDGDLSKPRLGACMRTLYDEYQRQRVGESYDTVPVSLVADHFAATNSMAIAPFFTAPDSTRRDLNVIEGQLSRIKNVRPSNIASPEIRKAFDEALACVVEEVQALQMYFAVAQGCEIIQNKLCDDVWRWQEAQFMLHRTRAGASADAEMINEVNRIQKDLRRELKRSA